MSHRVVETWRDAEIETLEDLLRPGLRAVCVGINPAPVSVAAGHYYQGRLGQAFFGRLRRAGLLPTDGGWDDDRAFAGGIGFTDLVKRPTASAAEIPADELAHGESIVISKLEAVRPEIVLFTFKKAATVIFGPFAGFGFVGKTVASAEMFVMPGPYERADRVSAALNDLGAWWAVGGRRRAAGSGARAAQQPVHLPRPVFEHLGRLRRMAHEVDAPHVVRLVGNTGNRLRTRLAYAEGDRLGSLSLERLERVVQHASTRCRTKVT